MDNSVKWLVRDSILRTVKKIGGEDLSKKISSFSIERSKKKEWGDLSTNLPFLLSSVSQTSPAKISEELISSLSEEDLFSRVEYAPPGFINFSLSFSYLKESLKRIIQEKEDYTRFSLGEERKVQVEFVSANPTGPLHVGHGRAAALGDALANNLGKLNYKVEREYYVNDVGGQIKKLAKSLWIRIRQLEGEQIAIPDDGYKGEYLIDLARIFKEKRGIIQQEEEDKIILELSGFAVEEILSQIREDLEKFGVSFDHWFFESELYKNNKLAEVLSILEGKNLIYEKDGALWFKTSAIIKDEEDRVLKRKNGEYTYFASDIAYHQDKFKRGFFKIIDIWGADHIGYLPRLVSAVRALGYPEEALKIVIYQLVSLKREGKRVPASTREGKFISLRELLEEVGKDAARFFFLSRSADSHLEFDLELAKKQTPENPVFYIQYAHARICSILKKAEEKRAFPVNYEKVNLDLLTSPEERELMWLISYLPDQVREAGERLEPHHLTVYLQELASSFHYFYTRHQVIGEDRELTSARLFLVQAVKLAILDLLGILGISAPERM